MPQTLVEIRKGISDPVPGRVIETLYREEGVLQVMPIEGVDGLVKPYDVRKSLPGVAFRKMNEAYSESIGVVQRQVETLKPLGGDSDIDVQIAKAYPSQRSRDDEAFVQAMAVKWVQTIFYGNSPSARAGASFTDVDGFDGIMKRLTDAGGSQIINNGAVSGSDGSSVFVIRFGDQYMTGLMANPSPYFDVRNLGETSAKPVYRTRFEAAGGMAIYNGKSVSWLKNITVGTTISVTKLDQAISAIVGMPSVIVMTKRTRDQLKAALFAMGLTLGRTISAIGDVLETYGPTPIVISDALHDAETVG